MKKRNWVFGYLVMILLIATFVGCASTSKQEGTGEYVDDSVITTKVKSLLAADDFLKSFEISVETYKGTVQLSGFVGSQM
ncbi:MAG: BON domain-containing protein, partial [Desulfobacterales bacterium]